MILWSETASTRLALKPPAHAKRPRRRRVDVSRVLAKAKVAGAKGDVVLLDAGSFYGKKLRVAVALKDDDRQIAIIGLCE